MKLATTIATYLLGLVFVVFGANHFFNFIPMPTDPMPENVTKFMSAMMDSGFMTVVKALEVIGGLMLLAGFKKPLGLAILLPIIVCILLTEVLLMKQPGIGIALTAIAGFLVYAWKDKFQAIWS